MARENKEKGGKLNHWMHYALTRFKSKFWKAFGEMELEKTSNGQFLIHIAKQGGLKPGGSFALREKFEGEGSPKQRSQALSALMELLARLEVAADPLLRDKIVVESHRSESPSKELGKLAKKVLATFRKQPDSYQQHLRQLPIHIRALEEEFRLGALGGKEFFREDLELIEHNQLLMKWRYFLAARNYERIHHLDPYSICQLDLASLNHATQQLSRPSSLIQVWQQTANFQENPTWEAYRTLKSTLQSVKEAAGMDPSELADSFRILLNYLLPRLNGGDPRILPEAFALLKENLEDGLFLQGRQIHPRDLKNIISICVRLNQIADARQLFERFQDRILDDVKGQAKAYNHAVILFGEQRFKEAGTLFVQVMHASDDFYLKTDGKIYAMRCLIELQVAAMDGSVNFFPGSEESFKVFFRRQKDFPEAVYQYYLGIFNVMAEFTAVWGSLERERAGKWKALHDKLERFSDPYLGQWLQEKVRRCLEAF